MPIPQAHLVGLGTGILLQVVTPWRLPLASTARRVVLGSLRRRREPALDTTTRVTLSSPRT